MLGRRTESLSALNRSKAPSHERHDRSDQELRRALAAEEGGRRWLRRLAIAGSIVAVLGGGSLAREAPPRSPREIRLEGDGEIGDIVEKVQATGAVQPLLQVNVGAQVNGRVTRVSVVFNSIVKKGDVLASIRRFVGLRPGVEPPPERAQLEQARAKQHMETSRANMSKVTLDRTERLFNDSLAAKGDLDTAKGQYLAAKASYDATVAAVTGAQAAIGAQQAQLNQMTTNLGYTKIYSPVDGVVVTRSIDPGATVVSSFQAPVLFVIAQDLKKMRVMADVDEADVGLKEGMPETPSWTPFPGSPSTGFLLAEQRLGRRDLLGGRRGFTTGGEPPPSRSRPPR